MIIWERNILNELGNLAKNISGREFWTSIYNKGGKRREKNQRKPLNTKKVGLDGFENKVFSHL